MKVLTKFVPMIISVVIGCNITGGPLEPAPIKITKLDWQAADISRTDTLIIDTLTVSYHGARVEDGKLISKDTTYNASILADLLSGIDHGELWNRQSNLPEPGLSDYWIGKLTMTRSSGETKHITIYQSRLQDSLTNRLFTITYDLWP